MDAGIRLSEGWRGVRMPRFEEVLELTAGQIGLNIHIKGIGRDGSLLKHVCGLLVRHSLLNTAYASLDSEHDLKAALDYAPEIERACLVRQDDSDISLEIAGRYGCKRIQFFRQVETRHIRQAHEMGILCNLFHSDDPADALEYCRRGMDVILTNCAHAMVAGGMRAMSRFGLQP